MVLDRVSLDPWNYIYTSNSILLEACRNQELAPDPFCITLRSESMEMAYFAPNIIEFQQLANKSATVPDLLSRTTMWRILNYIRVGIFIAVSLGLIPLCVKLFRTNADKIWGREYFATQLKLASFIEGKIGEMASSTLQDSIAEWLRFWNTRIPLTNP